MDIIKIKQCLIAAKFLNISKAADFIGTSQSALSKTINAIENDLNIKIFIRLPRGLRLTSEGELIVQTFQNVKKEIENLPLKLKDLKSNHIGKFSIAMHPIIANRVLPNFEMQLVGISTNLSLDYIFQNSREATRSVLNCEVDFALVADAENFPDIVRTKLWSEFTGLYSVDGKLKTKVYYNMQMIGANKFLNKLKYDYVKSINDYELLAKVAIANKEVMAILPSSVIGLNSKLKLIKKLYTTDISLVYRFDSTKNMAFQQVISFIRKSIHD